MNAFSLISTESEKFTSPSEATMYTDAEQVGTHLHYAERCTQSRCYEQALEAWKQVIHYRPDSAYAYLNLGGILTELHCWPEAVVAFQQAAQLQPELKEAHYGLGMSYGQLGQFGAAIEAFQHATYIAPESALKVFHEERHRLHVSATPQGVTWVLGDVAGPEHEKGRRSNGKASGDSQNGDRARRGFWSLWQR